MKKTTKAILFGIFCATVSFVHAEQNKTVKTQEQKKFVPTVHIKEQTEEDRQLIEKMRPLFFEKTRSFNSQDTVYERSVNEYGAREVMLLTEDKFRISSLFFKRPQAKFNIIYVAGYFHDHTPPKEWAAPFTQIFPDCNVLSFDWRGMGKSEGSNNFLEKNDFGPNAYLDIQAAIDFVRKDNDLPIILQGFCFGGAMAMHATVKAMEEGRATADALGLSCMFNQFQNLFNRAFLVEDRWYYWALMKSGIGHKVLNFMLNGNMFDINPIEMVEKIKIPMLFDHYTNDPFAILSDGIEVYEKATVPKFFLQGDLGFHVRIHSKTPAQYRDAYNQALRQFGLIK